MCIILTCDSNVRPTRELLETCFANNPDGAGIASIAKDKNHENIVVVNKGFATMGELWNAVQAVPESSPLVIHMRIATSGGISDKLCHPFVIGGDVDTIRRTVTTCETAIAHNGVIPHMPTDDDNGISDTVSFVQTVVYPLMKSSWAMTDTIKRAIAKAAPGNRFAVIESDGKITRIGSGWVTVSKGIYASNDSWRYKRLSTISGKWYSRYMFDYDDDDDDDDIFDFGYQIHTYGKQSSRRMDYEDYVSAINEYCVGCENVACCLLDRYNCCPPVFNLLEEMEYNC